MRKTGEARPRPLQIPSIFAIQAVPDELAELRSSQAAGGQHQHDRVVFQSLYRSVLPEPGQKDFEFRFDHRLLCWMAPFRAVELAI